MNGIKNLIDAFSKGSDREDLSHMIFIDNNLYEIKTFFEDSYNIPVDYFYKSDKNGIKIEIFIGPQIEEVSSEDTKILRELVDAFDSARKSAKKIKNTKK